MIDTRGTGCTGYEVASALRASYDIYIELATHATLVLVLGLGQPVDALERLAHDLAETVKRICAGGRGDRASRGRRRRSSTRRWWRRATRSWARAKRWRSMDAVGRISAESIAGYPPGVPALLPGERVTVEVVAYLRELTAAGARLHGAADPTFATVRVLAQ